MRNVCNDGNLYNLVFHGQTQRWTKVESSSFKEKPHLARQARAPQGARLSRVNISALQVPHIGVARGVLFLSLDQSLRFGKSRGNSREARAIRRLRLRRSLDSSRRPRASRQARFVGNGRRSSASRLRSQPHQPHRTGQAIGGRRALLRWKHRPAGDQMQVAQREPDSDQ
jgi:hypothetical protein